MLREMYKHIIILQLMKVFGSNTLNQILQKDVIKERFTEENIILKQKNMEVNENPLSDPFSEDKGVRPIRNECTEMEKTCPLKNHVFSTSSEIVNDELETKGYFLDENSIFEILETNQAISKVLISDLTEFCMFEQITNQSNEILKMTCTGIRELHSGTAATYIQMIERLKLIANMLPSLYSKENLSIHSTLPFKDKSMSKHMEIFFCNMRKHISKISDNTLLDNSFDMHLTISIFICQLKGLTNFYLEDIKKLNECVGHICLELVKLQRHYHKIPELIILQSKICSTPDHPFFLICLVLLNLFLESKQEFDILDRQIVYILSIRILLPATNKRVFESCLMKIHLVRFF